MKAYYVYILASKRNGILHCSAVYNITKLVYAEEFLNINDAIYREKCIKKWNRVWKLKLIENHIS